MIFSQSSFASGVGLTFIKTKNSKSEVSWKDIIVSNVIMSLKNRSTKFFCVFFFGKAWNKVDFFEN